MSFDFIVLQLFSALSQGALIFLVAAGLTLIFGTLKVLNLAHGSIYMIGAYIAYTVANYMGGIIGHFYIGIIMAAVVAGLFGGVMEAFLIRPLYKLDMHFVFLLTFGVIFIVLYLVYIVWGALWHSITAPDYLMGAMNIGGVFLPKYNVFLIILSFIIFAAIHLFINKTKLGLIIRALTADRETVSTLGYNVPMTLTYVFMFGCALAGLGGALAAPIRVIVPGIDELALLDSFIVVIVGGFGSITGALLASIAIGLVNAFSFLAFPKLAAVFPFILMLIILVVRPRGLLGKPI